MRENWSSGFPTRSYTNGLCTYRRWLEAGIFGFRKMRDCTIRVVKTKVLISCAVTAQLICAFVFAQVKIHFPHDFAAFNPGIIL